MRTLATVVMVTLFGAVLANEPDFRPWALPMTYGLLLGGAVVTAAVLDITHKA